MGLTDAAPPATMIRRTSSAGCCGSGSILLERYQLDRLLGRGNFAKVYLARSLDDAADEVAIKVINKATTVDAAMEPRIIREVSAMRRLRRHPNILNLHEVMATKSKIYFVMELAHGGELFEKLHRCGRFSEPTARRYFQQVVSGLSFCHRNGVVHRDIKPQNLLLDRNGLVKITDFGLSALPEQKLGNLVHTACGTPAYTAPEVFKRKGYDGEKADAWSCGVLLYAFLVGSLPFDDSNIPNMFRAMHRGPLDFPDGVSKSARFVISRLLDPNPSTRLKLDEVLNLSWFKKSLPKENSSPEMKFEYEPKNLARVNAFDIISMSSGLDLSGIFEAEVRNKVMRFTSGGKVQQLEEIEVRVMKAGEAVGYRAGSGKGGGVVLTKGTAVVTVEVWEMAAELWLVEMKVVEGETVPWEELKTGLDEIALAWQSDGS